MCTDQALFTSQYGSEQICGFILMWEDNSDWLFYWRKRLFLIMNWYFGRRNGLNLKHLNYSFVSYKHAAFQVKSLIVGLEWCGLLVMFLSAVWTLILTAPIHCRGSTAEQVIMLHFSKSVLMKKQTHLHLGWPFSAIVFGVKPFRSWSQ